MIQSMTGYGRAQGSVGNHKLTVEIRSVNSKSLDLSLRIPSIYRATEPTLRSMASARILRGKAEISIQFDNEQSETSASINKDAFRAYYKELISLGREVGYEMDTEPLVASILRLPDVLTTPDKAKISEEDVLAVQQIAQQAMDAFEAFRLQEGAVLIADMSARVAKIENLLQLVEPYEGERIATVRTRLAESLERAKAVVDNNRFEAEIIYFLEKFDVTEEKVRLKQHLDYFRQVAWQGGDVGRKLGFISQEMGREINTLGSKANHYEIQKIVVNMKDELEKIKEQLLNIL